MSWDVPIHRFPCVKCGRGKEIRTSDPTELRVAMRRGCVKCRENRGSSRAENLNGHIDFEAREAEVLRRFNAEESDATIAEALGVHQRTVTRYKRQLGVGRAQPSTPPEVRERILRLRAEGWRADRISAVTGVSDWVVRKYWRTNVEPLSEEEAEKLRGVLGIKP